MQKCAMESLIIHIHVIGTHEGFWIPESIVKSHA